MKKFLFLLFIIGMYFTALQIDGMRHHETYMKQNTDIKSIVIDVDDKAQGLIKGTVIDGNTDFETGDRVTVTYCGTEWMLSDNLVIEYNNRLDNVISAWRIQNVEISIRGSDVL